MITLPTNDAAETTHKPAARAPRAIGRLARLAAAFAMACVAAGCVAEGAADDEADGPTAEDNQDLFAFGSKWSTSTDGITYIPVCWSGVSGHASEKEYTRSAVIGGWQAHSSIRFTGWGDCSGTPSGTVRLHNQDVSGSAGYWSGYESSVGSGGDIYLNLDFEFSNPSTPLGCDWFTGACDRCASHKSYCIGVTALHEFGHGVGMYHEQQRPDNTDGSYCDEFQSGETKGPSSGVVLTSSYDTDSIMNYCSEWDRNNPHISQGDGDGIAVRYGTKPNKLTNQVLLYADTVYTGSSQALYPGDYDLSSLKIGNDELSSLRIPSGWTVTLYQNSGFGGSSVTLTSDTVDLSSVSFNDAASSIKVTGPSASFPVIYKDGNYSGSSQTLRPGVYSAGDLTIGNDELSSITVPSGWSVTLYTDNNFGGTAVTYTSNSSLVSINDKTSSIKVTGPSAYWTPVVIYKDANYTGSAQALWPGRYQASDLSIGNDDLSSLTIPSGWTVYLLKDSPSYGGMKEYSSSQSSLSGDGFNDVTSAIVVEGPTS